MDDFEYQRHYRAMDRWLDVFLLKLPQRQRVIIQKTVLSDAMTITDLAEQFHVHKSRVIHLRKQALKNLEAMMENLKPPSNAT